jgi:hypothetical protein
MKTIVYVSCGCHNPFYYQGMEWRNYSHIRPEDLPESVDIRDVELENGARVGLARINRNQHIPQYWYDCLCMCADRDVVMNYHCDHEPEWALRASTATSTSLSTGMTAYSCVLIEVWS